jgi:hypothetical protein
MRARESLLGALLSALLGIGVLATPAASAAVPAPAWNIQALAAPTNFKPGEESGVDRYEAFVTNSGGEVTDGSPITITDTLPKGLGVKSLGLRERRNPFKELGPDACSTDVVGEVSTVTCTIEEGALPETEEPATVYPSEQFALTVQLKVPPSAAGQLTNRVEVEGGSAKPVAAESHNEANGAEEAKAGFQEFHAALTDSSGEPTTGADSHPYQYTTSFATNVELAGSIRVPAEGDVRQIEVTLPPGLAGNPTSVPYCTAQQFNTIKLRVIGAFQWGQNECPDASAVGVVNVEQLEGFQEMEPYPIYNLVPPKGMPAQFGFQVAGHGLPVYINTRLRSDSDYGVTAYLANTTEAQRVTASLVTFWGTPADPSHDHMRGECAFRSFSLGNGVCPANLPTVKPFFRLPSSCASPLSTSMRFDTWLHPGAFLQASASEPAPLGCELPDFSPTVESKATTNVADAPSGLHFDLHLPQAANEDPAGLGEADLREARVTLPEGLLVNPASADGLAACSESQIGYRGQLEGHPSFSAEPADCPAAAKVGSVEVDAPAIDHPLPGAVYLAAPHENPFDSLIAIYIAVEDPQSGVVVKLAGKVSLDPATGQLTTTVSGSPQVPFEDFKLDFFEGARAPLRTPAVCGVHATTTALTPWTAPASGPDATPSDSFETTQSPSGGTCPASAAGLPNAPRFEAGSQSPIAGAYSPFVVRLSRQDGSQELKGLNLTLPAGLSARFAGVAQCSDAAIASAEAKSGRQEQGSASCPASSQVGTVTVGAGAGPAPYYVKGNAYLAGPYKGAPLSMAIITPAVAGPFDLGTVVVRAPLYIDPETAQGTVKSSFPTILQGIPLDIRSIAVAIDRSQFTLNPTSCEAKAVTGEAIPVQGQSVPLNNRFQVGGCTNLGFKPSLALKLKGGTKRGDNPALTATLTYPSKGAYANIAFAQVALPHSEFLDQAHIKTICTRVQFAANACPKGAVYGFAKAVTPLFDKPLEGLVYLRSSNNPLPDLVADLNGQIHIVLAGRVDSIHGGIRNTFEVVPDAPVSKFTLSLPAGKKGLLQNSTDICRGTHRATAKFIAHNGKVLEARPQLGVKCGGGGKHRGKPDRKG